MDEPEVRHKFITRLTDNPIRLRRNARLALLLLACLLGATRFLVGGALASFLFALCWVLLPFVALAIAYGDAFLLRHGVGGRRVLLTLISGVFSALAACVVLSIAGDDAASGVAGAVGYALLFSALALALSAAFALAFGRSGDYLARRVAKLSEEDW
jgi:hypothetical protein